MSTDYKLMFGFMACMMLLMLIGGILTVILELAIAGGWLFVAACISVWRRRRAGWRWRGIGLKEAAFAIFGLALVSLFLAAAAPLAPPMHPQMLPWYLAGAGIGLFGLLSTLKLVRFSETAFLADCAEHPPTETSDAETEVGWKRLLRWTYSALFLGVWLTFVAYFYLFGREMRNGSSVPTDSQTEPLTNHGQTVYITAQVKHLVDLLETASFIGIPSIMILGAILHFGLGVRVFGRLGH